ncbi:hypothetical protein DY000_02014041 [Brassica cretica]|uniref:Retrotransposon gag domain-containing protein n=1 Tax=Brassica cretica TaxID=69181 RepID=A0ABQ7D085_BRACR|nr:hypothetical protein DY000_02014041 [Brassica cretica]
MEQAMAGQIQNQNQRQPQSKRQDVPATGNSQPDELKGLGMMMQQLLQGMQIHGKALNQVSSDINTRMDNMFTELNTKYDTVINHIKRIDVQLAQTAESVKPASSDVTAPDEPIEIPPVRVYVPKVPYPIPPKHLMDPISAGKLAGFRKMVRRLPQNISFERAWEIRPLHMFFKNCRESQKEINALFTEALTPSLKVLPKVDDPGKFVFPCSIAGGEFKEALCDSGSSVSLVSRAIIDELNIVDTEPSQQTIQAQQDAAEQAALTQQEQQAQNELTVKVDQLLKNNQGHVFSMDQAMVGQIQNQNQRQPQSNRQAVPATGNSQPDELKGLGMMMQQLLQGMKIHGNALNQVSTDINTRMDNMFTELNTKYDTVSNHIKRIDVQLAQTTERVKSQQGDLPGKNVMNPRVEHCNVAELRCEKSEGKEPEQLSVETVPDAEERTEHSTSSK